MELNAVNIKVISSGKIVTAVLNSDGTEAAYFEGSFLHYLKSPLLFKVIVPADENIDATAVRFLNLESSLNLLQPKKLHISFEL